MFKLQVKVLELWRGSPDQEAKRAAVVDKFITEHTYEVYDRDYLPSSGEIFDEIGHFAAKAGYPCDSVYQEYEGYDWLVMHDNVPVLHLYLHELSEVQVYIETLENDDVQS